MSNIPVLTLKLLLISWITAKRQIIHNRTASRNTWDNTYDFVIVGAGTAGCVVANRLTENPNIKVLLIEAGGPQSAKYNDIPGGVSQLYEKRPDLKWNYYNEPQEITGGLYPQRRIPEPMGKTLGGSSSYNQMVYNRGNKKGYNDWADTYGAEGWSYEEVLPFFKKFENNTDWNIIEDNPGYHGISGPVQISSPKDPDQILFINKKVFNDLGFMNTDINGRNQTGVMIGQSFIGQNGLRSGAGTSYIDPNPHPNNLHILSKALVTKILFNGTTAVGVEFKKNDVIHQVFARKEVILSAGPYNSPQLLMLSGIGPTNHLKEFEIPVLIDLPVGNNLINHVGLRFHCDVDQNLINPDPELTTEQLIELYINGSGLLAQNTYLALYFSTKYNLDKDWPNIILYPNAFNGKFTFIQSLVKIKSRGTVRLQSNSPYIQPKIEPNFLYDSRDFEDMVEGLRFILFVVENTSFAQYVSPPNFESFNCTSCENRYMYECDQGIRCLIRQIASSFDHPSGTCRMGALDRDDVVVDPQLKVKHAQKLRVCDSSIYPDIPNANLNAATLMVGEKCSQIIKDYYHLN